MSSKKRNRRFGLGLAVAIMLPLSFFLIARFLSADQLNLPKYYIKTGVEERMVDGEKVVDTLYHQISDVQLTNQFGKQVSINSDLKGKILLVDFFFTSCPTICTRLTNNMVMVQQAFKKNDTAIHLLSFTVNPERDSPTVLRTYADRHQVDHDNWWFLTGDKETIYNFARQELKVSVQPGHGGVEDLIHTQKLVLIDKDRYIRGYYDGLDTADLRRCADDIVLLGLEKKKKKK